MEPAVGTNRKNASLNHTTLCAEKTKSGNLLTGGRRAMVSMVFIMFLIGVLIFLFAGRLAEVLLARARLRAESDPMMKKRRWHEPHGRLAVETVRA
jgi:hypothetical protein